MLSKVSKIEGSYLIKFLEKSILSLYINSENASLNIII